MSEQKENQLFQLMVNANAMLEQVMQTLESMDRRLANVELKVSRIEKCVSYENADFDPLKRNA